MEKIVKDFDQDPRDRKESEEGWATVRRQQRFLAAGWVLLVFAFIGGMTLLALENYSLITVLYPTTLMVAELLLVLMILYRRAAMNRRCGPRADIPVARIQPVRQAARQIVGYAAAGDVRQALDAARLVGLREGGLEAELHAQAERRSRAVERSRLPEYDLVRGDAVLGKCRDRASHERCERDGYRLECDEAHACYP